jgi:hypothetical protein
MDPGAFSYFPTSYFSPFFFPELAATVPIQPLTPAGARDRDVFRALQAALQSLGVFDAVLLHQHGDTAHATADRNPIAVVRRTDWTESNIASPTTIERNVNFEILIALRDDDPEPRFEALERLENLALNALDGQDWAGVCLRDKTSIQRGLDDTSARHPEARVILKGQFTYVVEGYAGRDMTAT